MNWEEKLVSINLLTKHTLAMRKPGDWYVTTPKGFVDIVSFSNSALRSETPDQNGCSSPEEAVEMYWRQIVDDLSPDEYILASDPGNTRRVRWNGFIWGAVDRLLKVV